MPSRVPRDKECHCTLFMRAKIAGALDNLIGRIKEGSSDKSMRLSTAALAEASADSNAARKKRLGAAGRIISLTWTHRCIYGWLHKYVQKMSLRYALSLLRFGHSSWTVVHAKAKLHIVSLLQVPSQVWWSIWTAANQLVASPA